MQGSRFCSAISCARRCFLTVSGKYVPPLTVASLATITHSRPSTMPIPVTIPADGAWPSYTSQAASADSSRKALPGSTRRSTRSRAVSLPRERCRSTDAPPPPAATPAARSRSSATSPSIRSRRRAKRSLSRSTCEVSSIGVSLTAPPVVAQLSPGACRYRRCRCGLLGEAESRTAPARSRSAHRKTVRPRGRSSRRLAPSRGPCRPPPSVYHPPAMARRPLSELTRELTAVCMGREPADTVIRGGRLVNVHTREVLDGVDVAIAHGRVAMVGDVAHTVGSATETIDADDAFLVPGLIDTHLHVESVMVTVTRFAEAVVPHGTTTAFIDNHEMANVFGLEGMRWMLEEGRGLPLKVFLAVPSCVPALPGFEDAGAELGPDEIREALDWEGVAGLGEMMNMPGVIAGDESVHAEIAAALERGKPVTGHWSLAGVRDHRLQAYIAAGVDSCHETTSREDALAKLRSGMWVQFREGSTFRDVEALAAVITEDGVDPRHCLLVTDDVLPDTIESDGHMDRVVRRAIESGVDPLVAVQMATVNGAEYFGMRHDQCSICPGQIADIRFVEDLRDFRPHLIRADARELS